eukprot:4636474-Pyramimonas_sp.AAC.1
MDIRVEEARGAEGVESGVHDGLDPRETIGSHLLLNPPNDHLVECNEEGWAPYAALPHPLPHHQ